MSIVINGTTVENVVYNGVDLKKLIYDGTIVFYKGEAIVAIYFCGNWKMNQTKATIDTFFETFNTSLTLNTAKEVIIFPPAIYLQYCQSKLSSSLSSMVKWGMQLISKNTSGAFTGQISAQQAADMGATYALVGELECREYLGITDDDCRQQIAQCWNNGITPVLCIGEDLTEHEAGETSSVLETQIRNALSNWFPTSQNLVIAYEPVWAIGTGKTCTPDNYNEAIAIIKQILSTLFDASTAEETPIIFGGSAKPSNAQELNVTGNKGFLSSGISLKADQLAQLVNIDY